MARSLAPFFLVFLAFSGVALAQDVEVQTLEEGSTEGSGILGVRRPREQLSEVPPVVVVERTAPEPDASPIIVVVPDPLNDPPAAAPEEESPLLWLGWGVFVERLELEGLGLEFSNPEVSALDGTHIAPTGRWGHPVTGGASLGWMMEPLPWLRFPEMRFEIGGGSSDGPWVTPQDAGADVTARLTSIFLLRAELRGGIVLPFKWVQPYVVGRLAVAGYFVDADVQHATLGALGTETMSAAAFEAGVEAGATFRITEGVELFAAWRESFTGARASGGVFGVVAAMPNE